jgi:hypothetical protein
MSMHEVEGPFGVPVRVSEETAQLKASELNLFDATAVAVSSVAPAYSLASTISLVFVLAGVGLHAPSVIIMSFVPVLFIAHSYFHLNRKDPDCGASYSWLSKLLSPYVGWFNGWVQVATSAIFCVSAPILAGAYTLQFANSVGWINSSTAANVWLTAVIAIIWLVLITAICVYGIRWTTNLQWVLVLIEYIVVIGFSIGGIIKVMVSHPHNSTSFHFGWLNPLTVFHQGGMGAVAGGVALGAFFFWGWDTAVNLNEETKNPSVTPGRGAIISMWLLLAVFMLNLIAVQMLLTPKEISDQGANVLFYFGNQLFGSWAGYVMIFAVISSTVATTQTTLLPAARIAYSMSRDKVFPAVFGKIHHKFLTPAFGTVALALFSLAGILLSTGVTSVNQLLSKLVGDIGILVAFYYGLTGIACAWGFRKMAFKKLGFFFTGVFLPLISGVFLIYIGFWIMKSDVGTATPDLIVLGVGIPLAVLARFTTKGDFFKTKTIAYSELD